MEKNFKPVESLKKSVAPLIGEGNSFFSWLIAGLAFLLPLFFLPLTANFYYLNKITLLYLITGILLLAWVLKIFFDKKIELVRAPLNLPVLALIAVYIASCLLQSPNQIKALLNSAGPIAASGILYFIVINFLKKKEVSRVFGALISSAMIAGWLSIFSFLGLFEGASVNWMKGKFFTPTGSPLVSGSLFLVLGISALVWAFKTKKIFKKVLLFLCAGVQITALLLIGYLFASGEVSLSYLLPNFGWQIAVEGLKNIRTALLGVGPGNFLSAFNRFRPVAMNDTKMWNVQFSSNTNQYLHLWSTVGLLGLGAYVWLMFTALRRDNIKGSSLNRALYVGLMVSFLLQVVFSASFVLLFATMLLASLLQLGNLGKEKKKITLKQSFPVWLVIIAGTALIIVTFWMQGRAWAADHFYYRSLQAAAANNGGLTYNLQIKAIKFNPYEENYRVGYSNTNLALANTLSQQENLTDQKKSNIMQLVRQSIREAKAATALNPQISGYWQNLAGVYRNLISVADDASQWATASFVQAVRTDPTNPLLRVNFGSLFFALEDYERAVTQFMQAANLKPDLANAYYNLAVTYREQEEWEKAYVNMRQVLGLVEIDSDTYNLVNDELGEIAGNLEQVPEATRSVEATEEQEITPPELPPSPVPDEKKIDLPEEAAPEIPEEPVVEEGEPATESGGI